MSGDSTQLPKSKIKELKRRKKQKEVKSFRESAEIVASSAQKVGRFFDNLNEIVIPAVKKFAPMLEMMQLAFFKGFGDSENDDGINLDEIEKSIAEADEQFADLTPELQAELDSEIDTDFKPEDLRGDSFGLDEIFTEKSVDLIPDSEGIHDASVKTKET